MKDKVDYIGGIANSVSKALDGPMGKLLKDYKSTVMGVVNFIQSGVKNITIILNKVQTYIDRVRDFIDYLKTTILNAIKPILAFIDGVCRNVTNIGN